MAKPSRREHIVDVASKLFYKGGFHATGVETIREVAGVSKKTLYNHFRSKDELIIAVLRRRDELFRNQFMRSVERLGKTPRLRLEAIFDALAEWINSDDFYGCIFINASAEFTAQDNPCHIECAQSKRLIFNYVRDLAESAGAKDPSLLSDQITLLVEGAIVRAHTCGDKHAALKAKEMGKVFIEQSAIP